MPVLIRFFLTPALAGSFLSATLAIGADLTVHVATPNGAPRIVVNGESVRARMFFGGPGSTPLPIGPEWKSIDFTFTATGDADKGTMHFRFGTTAGEVFLRDLHVTDLDAHQDLIAPGTLDHGAEAFDKDWTHWPADAANTVGKILWEPNAESSGGVHVKLTAPTSGPWPDFHIYHHPNLSIVAGHHYQVHFFAKATSARLLNIGFYQPGQPYRHVGGPPDPFPAQIKLAAQVGVNFVSFPVGLPWPKDGEPVKWDELDRSCQAVLDANPKALLIPRIPMEPPAWWREAHPDEVMQWEDGHRAMAVPASPLYRKEASERLAAFVTHLEEKFGDHVAGYHPVGQNTGEWFYEDTWKKLLNGYAPADLSAWRVWLRKHYKTDEAMRTMWSDSTVAPETATVPSPAARHAAPDGIFRDLATEQAVADWGRYQQDAMADCVCELAHAARKASGGKKLVLFFYGYVHELAGVANGPATSGHYALRRVLDSPDIDILCSPISYFDRGLGGSAPSMSAAESAALAGKMWLNEDDTHTYLATGDPPGSRDHVTTLEATNEELTRNVAEEALRNFATWWMDLTFTGWFNDPGMWQQMKKLDALDAWFLKNPTPFHPEVAAVVDDAVMSFVSAQSTKVLNPCVYESRARLARMGAPYGQYLLDDVVSGKVKAKLYVFLNAWGLTAADRKKLLQATQGSVRVWCYAPGYFDGDNVSPEAMQELTGLPLQRRVGLKGWAIPSDTAQALGIQKAFGVQEMVNPLFGVGVIPAEQILGLYPDGHTAIAIQPDAEGKGASIFVGVPGLTSELLRMAARRAGVHLFTQTDCNVYANGPFLAVHGSQDGTVDLDTGAALPVTDVLSGDAVGKGPKLTLPLKRGETRVLRIAK